MAERRAARRGGPERRVDARAMGCFLAALKAGENVEAAARAAGFHWRTFYRRRDGDPDFAAAWGEAVELSNRPMLLAPGNGRRLQLRKTRKVRFTEARRETFLAHFAGTCDLTTSAEAAGVCADTVNNHRRKDADFAEACQAALEQGYARLEEEAVRQRLEAQRKLKEGVLPEGEVTAEFERLCKLLAHWTRRNGRPGPRTVARERLERWTFEAAIQALEKKLRAMKIPIVGEEGPLHPLSGGSPPRPGED
jgi:hypothetical protein